MKESIKSGNKGIASTTIEVEANGISFKGSATAADKRTAKKIIISNLIIILKIKSHLR
jgi:hypothetical protein